MSINDMGRIIITQPNAGEAHQVHLVPPRGVLLLSVCASYKNQNIKHTTETKSSQALRERLTYVFVLLFAVGVISTVRRKSKSFSPYTEIGVCSVLHNNLCNTPSTHHPRSWRDDICPL